MLLQTCDHSLHVVGYLAAPRIFQQRIHPGRQLERDSSRMARAIGQSDPVFRQGVIGVAIYYAIMMAYFLLIGRHKLILSPEEEFALSTGASDYKSI